MAYIGRELQDADAVVDTKTWNNSDTTLTLSVDPGSVNNVAYFEDGVRQVPTTDYTVSGLTLTRTSTPANGVIGMAVSGSTLTIGTPADGTVTNAKIAEDINVANGGTGASTHTANSVLVGEGTSAISSIAPSTSGNVLTSNGTTWTSTAAANASLTGITDNATVSAITISADEEVTIPKQPSFFAKANTSQNNVTGDNTVYTINYNTEAFDQNADFASNTFTAPVTGKYLLAGGAYVSAGKTTSHTSTVVTITTSNRNVKLFTSNTSLWLQQYDFLSNGAVVIDMDAGDTANMTLQVGPTGKTVDLYGDGTANAHTWFSGCLLA